MHSSHLLLDRAPRTIFNNVSPLPCSHPACSEFCVHLEFLPEIVCKVGKVCKVEKVRSTFHTFHDYLNFCGEKKDDGLLTIYFVSAIAGTYLYGNIRFLYLLFELSYLYSTSKRVNVKHTGYTYNFPFLIPMLPKFFLSRLCANEN